MLHHHVNSTSFVAGQVRQSATKIWQCGSSLEGSDYVISYTDYYEIKLVKIKRLK